MPNGSIWRCQACRYKNIEPCDMSMIPACVLAIRGLPLHSFALEQLQAQTDLWLPDGVEALLQSLGRSSIKLVPKFFSALDEPVLSMSKRCTVRLTILRSMGPS